ncbi:hypothetical protein ABIB50_001994 [Mucilaginibacter sp. UYCu711]
MLQTSFFNLSQPFHTTLVITGPCNKKVFLASNIVELTNWLIHKFFENNTRM